MRAARMARDVGAVHDGLGAEAAAEERAAQQHILGRNAEIAGKGGARHGQRLVGRVERQPVAVPFRDHGMRLHGVVVLGRRFNGNVDTVRGGGMPRGDVALGEIRRRADADRGRIVALAVIEAHARRLRLIGRRQQARAFGGCLERFGDDQRDRLLGVAHAVVLQRLEAEVEQPVLFVGILRQRRAVGRRDDLDDAGMRPGGGDIKRGDAAARNGADGDHGVQHAGGMIVGGVGGRARDLEKSVAPGQRLAAGGTETDMRCRQGDGIRHRT